MTDSIDRACEMEQLQRDDALRNHALNNANQKGYENICVCIDCETKIPTGRLKAHPNAVRCMDCQSAVEQQK